MGGKGETGYGAVGSWVEASVGAMYTIGDTLFLPLSPSTPVDHFPSSNANIYMSIKEWLRNSNITAIAFTVSYGITLLVFSNCMGDPW